MPHQKTNYDEALPENDMHASRATTRIFVRSSVALFCSVFVWRPAPCGKLRAFLGIPGGRDQHRSNRKLESEKKTNGKFSWEAAGRALSDAVSPAFWTVTKLMDFWESTQIMGTMSMWSMCIKTSGWCCSFGKNPYVPLEDQGSTMDLRDCVPVWYLGHLPNSETGEKAEFYGFLAVWLKNRVYNKQFQCGKTKRSVNSNDPKWNTRKVQNLSTMKSNFRSFTEIPTFPAIQRPRTRA